MFQEETSKVRHKKLLNKIDNQGMNTGIISGSVNASKITINNNTIDFEKKKRRSYSLIPELIKKLAELTNLPEEEMDKLYKVTDDDTKAYGITKKINYNHVIKYKNIINEYSQYCDICKEALNIIDNNNIGSKAKILRSISILYEQCKGDLILQYKKSKMKEIDIIRENADKIIDNIKNILEQRIILDDQSQNISMEDIDIGLVRIICYLFVECKILEKPR